MTAYELLWLYARLRGIPEKKIKDAVETEIKRLDLLKHADRLCGTYRWVIICFHKVLMIYSFVVVGTNVN